MLLKKEGEDTASLLWEIWYNYSTHTHTASRHSDTHAHTSVFAYLQLTSLLFSNFSSVFSLHPFTKIHWLKFSVLKITVSFHTDKMALNFICKNKQDQII